VHPPSPEDEDDILPDEEDAEVDVVDDDAPDEPELVEEAPPSVNDPQPSAAASMEHTLTKPIARRSATRRLYQGARGENKR